jgi:uncharacterized protein YdaU (DUF1376 family)
VNYYERHLGDYARDTAHLSMLEHGAYTLLMDRYYATEQGIPADQAHRVARARSRDEKAATDSVLSEFFTLVDGVWIQGRIEAELGAAQGRINAARVNGTKGGRPKKKNPVGSKQKPSGFELGSENETQPKAPHLSNPQYSEANASGADAPNETQPDPIWGAGLAFLIRKGIPEKPARGLLGQLRKAAGDVQTGAILADAESQDISDPAPWLMAAAAKARRANGAPNGTDKKLSASEQTRAAIAERRARESADAAH